MEKLMISPKGSTLFARLVAIRIKLSQFLSGLNYNLDRNYQRLLQQQTLCLRALRNKVNVSKDAYFNSQFMKRPEDYRRSERAYQRFNSITGSY